MWPMKRTAIVLAVTAIAVIVGIVLWNSEEPQKLSPDSGGDGVWALGPQDAPVLIKTFPDFT